MNKFQEVDNGGKQILGYAILNLLERKEGLEEAVKEARKIISKTKREINKACEQSISTMELMIEDIDRALAEITPPHERQEDGSVL